jgi:hypothetical protein
MSQPNTANWIRPGLLALPLYGLLTLDYTRSPARPEHRLRGLGSLRQHQLLRAEVFSIGLADGPGAPSSSATTSPSGYCTALRRSIP